MSLLGSQKNDLSSLLEKYQQLQKKSEPSAPLKQTEPIVGLRVWRITTLGGQPYLQSAAHSSVWPYRKALEKDALMHMGIHAIKLGDIGWPSVADPAAIYAYGLTGLFQAYVVQPGHQGVAGEVYLWGKVVQHTHGYLADFAYPKKLFCPPEMDVVTVMRLEDEYGVPCEFREEFARPKAPEPNPFAFPSVSSIATPQYFSGGLGNSGGLQQAYPSQQAYQQMQGLYYSHQAIQTANAQFLKPGSIVDLFKSTP